MAFKNPKQRQMQKKRRARLQKKARKRTRPTGGPGRPGKSKQKAMAVKRKTQPVGQKPKQLKKKNQPAKNHPAKQKKKVNDASKLPRSPDYKQAQQSIARGNLMNMIGDQSRVQDVLRGAFGSPKLRRGGTNVYGYSIKKPKGDPGWKNPYG